MKSTQRRETGVPCITRVAKVELNDMGGPESPLSSFHKIKETFFICIKSFIDLDILSMSAASHMV